MRCFLQKQKIEMSDCFADSAKPYTIAALYRFARFTNHTAMRAPLETICRELGVRGTLLLAPEGINGTIAGPREGIGIALQHIRGLRGCSDLNVQVSSAPTMPFRRLKVRIKHEIVTMGEPRVDPLAAVGTYVEAQNWNALISDPDTILIDTRNEYEISIGTFPSAINPKIASFRDFPAWFRNARDGLLGSKSRPNIAMFCTGGIRCEKSTAFLKQEGIEDVHHLKGGILRYLESVPENASLWQGECFVFDERVAVGHDRSGGTHQSCRACRRPLNAQDLGSAHYEPGTSCTGCYSTRTEKQRDSHRERHRQETLALQQGRSHVGATQTYRTTQPAPSRDVPNV